MHLLESYPGFRRVLKHEWARESRFAKRGMTSVVWRCHRYDRRTTSGCHFVHTTHSRPKSNFKWQSTRCPRQQLQPSWYPQQFLPRWQAKTPLYLSGRELMLFVEASLGQIDVVKIKLAHNERELRREIDSLREELKHDQDPGRMQLIQEMISVSNTFLFIRSIIWICLQDLLGQMSRIREKATESEAVVRDITKDIQVLDLAKKNLILSMTTLKRLHMLGAYDHLLWLISITSTYIVLTSQCFVAARGPNTRAQIHWNGSNSISKYQSVILQDLDHNVSPVVRP